MPTRVSESSGQIVCVSGDFCSGSTLLFTLFRHAGTYRCLYEPLHEDLREFLVYGLRPDEHRHHFFVDHYHREFRGLRKVGTLFDRKWGDSQFHLAATDEAPDLRRYLTYLIEASLERSPRMMFKENRMAFRLGWFREHFPSAKLVHIFRRKESQWRSVVRRVQADRRRADVGQDRVDFNGFSLATWCDDLQATYPELAADRFTSGVDRFGKLWELSYREHRRYADISVAYEDLVKDFVPTARRMFAAIGARDIDVNDLKQYIVRPDRKPPTLAAVSKVADTVTGATDRVLRRYAAAHARLRWRS
jgi:hypothetical protein